MLKQPRKRLRIKCHMKKILFISGIQIFPPQSGGQLRSANICIALAKKGFLVEIYSFTGRKKDYARLKKSSEEKIANNLSEYTNRNLLLGIIQFVFYNLKLPPIWLTYQIRYFIPKMLTQKINDCDSILIDFPFLYPIHNHISRKPFRVNTHNCEYELYSKNKLLSKLVKKIELNSFAKADHILFCNQDDLEKFTPFQSELTLKSSILPNAVDIHNFNYDIKLRNKTRLQLNIRNEQKVILFTGSFYPPNTEALTFLQEWSSKNSETLLNLNILILAVGTAATNKKNLPYFKSVGRVENIIPYFAASDFGINPVISGSGTNVKMFEFLAAQLPIITSRFGARGLKLLDHETCFYFERDNLMKVIKGAVCINTYKRKEMAKTALNNNLVNVDISKAIESLNIQW